MRTISPPFTEAEITRERLALEEAVRRVEGETSQREREARIPSFSNLVTDTEDVGKTAAVPPMIVTDGATGRLTRIWRVPIHGHLERAARSGKSPHLGVVSLAALQFRAARIRVPSSLPPLRSGEVSLV
jgi:hypothetical protein